MVRGWWWWWCSSFSYSSSCLSFPFLSAPLYIVVCTVCMYVDLSCLLYVAVNRSDQIRPEQEPTLLRILHLPPSNILPSWPKRSPSPSIHHIDASSCTPVHLQIQFNSVTLNSIAIRREREREILITINWLTDRPTFSPFAFLPNRLTPHTYTFLPSVHLPHSFY